MADAIKVDSEFLERLSKEFRSAALESEEHADRFASRCGHVGEAYGTLPQSQDAAGQYLTAVSSMSDHLRQRIAEQHAHADALAAAAKRYRAVEAAAMEAAADWAGDSPASWGI
jgi:hypothetical protein